MEQRFFIIGAGLGAPALLTDEARRALQDAKLVIGTKRLAKTLAPMRENIMVCPFGDMALCAKESKAETVALLVSGDVGFFSAAHKLYETLSTAGETTLLCGISSLQYFCAKLGTCYNDVAIRSLHGRQGSLLGAVSYNRKVFALTGGEHTAQGICRELTAAGLGGVFVSLGENLGATDERMMQGTAAMLADEQCDGLAVLLIENDGATDASIPVADKMLTRGNVPMTKEEIRWVSAAKLAVRPDDIVWDIGAGTGSVSIELARRAANGLVYAIERNADAISLLCRNRYALGAYNIKVIEGAAPDALDTLPAPDAVFIGGSGGHMADLLAFIKEKNPKVRVVVNAIALETVHETIAALKANHFCNIECSQISSARGREVGAYTMMTANNPVFILSGGGA